MDKLTPEQLYESAVSFIILNELDPKIVCKSGRTVGQVVIDCISKAITVEQLEEEIGKSIEEGIETEDKHLPGKHDQKDHGRLGTGVQEPPELKVEGVRLPADREKIVDLGIQLLKFGYEQVGVTENAKSDQVIEAMQEVVEISRQFDELLPKAPFNLKLVFEHGEFVDANAAYDTQKSVLTIGGPHGESVAHELGHHVDMWLAVVYGPREDLGLSRSELSETLGRVNAAHRKMLEIVNDYMTADPKHAEMWRLADKDNKEPYWTDPAELFGRAFEQYFTLKTGYKPKRGRGLGEWEYDRKNTWVWPKEAFLPIAAKMDELFTLSNLKSLAEKHLPGRHNQHDHAPAHLRDSAHQRYAQSMRSVESLSMAGKKGYQALIDKYGLEYAQDKTADWRRAHPSSLQVQVEDMLDEVGVPYDREVKLAPMLYTDILIGKKAIEVDGKPWHSNKAFYGQGNRADADVIRDQRIHEAGYDVLHITEDSLGSIEAFNRLISYLGVQKHLPGMHDQQKHAHYYHGTIAEAEDKIKEEGLRVHHRGNRLVGRTDPHRLYLSRDKSLALEVAFVHAIRSSDKPVIYLLDVSLPKDRKIKVDPDADERGVYTLGNISKENIVETKKLRIKPSVWRIGKKNYAHEDWDDIYTWLQLSSRNIYDTLVPEDVSTLKAENEEYCIALTAEDYDRFMAENKHLAGKHDQKKHGRGGLDFKAPGIESMDDITRVFVPLPDKFKVVAPIVTAVADLERMFKSVSFPGGNDMTIRDLRESVIEVSTIAAELKEAYPNLPLDELNVVFFDAYKANAAYDNDTTSIIIFGSHGESVFHEIGHFLDAKMAGVEGTDAHFSQYQSAAGITVDVDGKTNLPAKIVEAVRNSPMPRVWMSNADPDPMYQSYLMRPTEIFARGFEQHTASRSEKLMLAMKYEFRDQHGFEPSQNDLAMRNFWIEPWYFDSHIKPMYNSLEYLQTRAITKDFAAEYPQPLGPTELLTQGGRFVFWKKRRAKRLQKIIAGVKVYAETVKLKSATEEVNKHMMGRHDQKTHAGKRMTSVFDLPVADLERHDTEADWARLGLRQPADEELVDAYGMDLPNYQTKVAVRPEEGYAGVIEVITSAELKDEEGKTAQMQVLVRKFMKDWNGQTYVYHDMFHLPSDYQAKGMGTGVLERSEEMYKRLGIGDVRLVANSSVGRYAWARMGFDFGSEDDKKNVLTEDHGSLGGQLSFKQYLEKFDIPASKHPKVNHTWEVAAWKAGDNDGPWLKMGLPRPNGKAFLLWHAASYNASKKLNDSDVGYRIGQEYYRLKKEMKNGRRA